jgi:hypothetical protein
LALAALDHVLPAGRAGVPLDGVPPPAQVAGNVAQANALGEEIVDEGVVGAGSFGELAGRVFRFGVFAGCRNSGCLPCGLGFRRGRRQVVQAGAVAGDGLLDRGGEVLPEMDRSATWRAACGAAVSAASA